LGEWRAEASLALGREFGCFNDIFRIFDGVQERNEDAMGAAVKCTCDFE